MSEQLTLMTKYLHVRKEKNYLVQKNQIVVVLVQFMAYLSSI